MRIGDPVTYQGRRYVLRGLDPMGIPDRLADIEDVETGEVIRVPVSELDRRLKIRRAQGVATLVWGH